MQPLGFGGGFFLLERAMRTHSGAGGTSEVREVREVEGGAEGDAEGCAVGVTDGGAARGTHPTQNLTLALTRPARPLALALPPTRMAARRAARTYSPLWP